MVPCRLFEDVTALLASREKVVEAKQLRGEERLAVLRSKARLESDAAIDSSETKHYSVQGFISFLCQYSSDIAFYEERAGQFFPLDLEYAQFVRDTVASVVEHREKERRLEEQALRRKKESIRRLNSLPNAYEKHVVSLQTSLSRLYDAPLKRRSQRHRTVSAQLISSQRGNAASRGSAKPQPAERAKEITHLSSERFWKSVEGVYRRLLPRLSELMEGFAPDEVAATRLLPERAFQEQWSAGSAEPTVRLGRGLEVRRSVLLEGETTADVGFAVRKWGFEAGLSVGARQRAKPSRWKRATVATCGETER